MKAAKALSASTRIEREPSFQVIDQAEEIIRLKLRIEELEAALQEASQKINWFQKQLFGRKSEIRKFTEDTSADRQLKLPINIGPEKAKAEPKAVVEVGSYQRTRKKAWPADAVNEQGLRFGPEVPVVEIKVPNPEVDALAEEEKKLVSEEVTFKLAQRRGYYVKKIVRQVVKIADGFSTPPPPPAILPGSIADDSFLIGMVVDKFDYHQPLNRLHRKLVASRIYIARSNLTQWVHELGDILMPVYAAHLRSVLRSRLLTMDETPVLAKPEDSASLQQCWFWAMYGDRDEVVFCFAGSRKHENVGKILGEYRGILLTDGFEGYKQHAANTGGLLHALCWSHTRRYFIKAEEVEAALAKRAISYIGQLYQIEREIREKALTREEKLGARQKYSAPVYNEFFGWLNEQAHFASSRPKNPFSKALVYTLPRKEGLSVFLREPDVPLDTNHLERENKKKAIGAHNWLFNWSEHGAHCMATFYSLLSTCKLHNIDPYIYLQDVLTQATSVKGVKFDDLTPRRWKELNQKPDNPP